MTRARISCSCAGALVVLGWAASASAYQCKHSETSEYVTLHWPDRRIAYAIEDGLDISPLIVDAAFASWSVEPCTDITFVPMGIVPQGTPVSRVGAVQQGWVEGGHEPEQIAVTLTFYERATGALAQAEIALNDELFDFADVSLGCEESAERYDFASVLTHEAGHYIGLDHTTLFKGDESDPTMAPTVEPCGMQKRSLARDDVAGLCRIYPSGEPTQPCASLPVQARYVEGEAFGCRAARGQRSAAGPSGLLLLIFGLAFSGKTCGRVEDGG